MNKLIVADVNANMTNRSFGAEKNQIAFNQFIAVNTNTDDGLFTGGTRKVDVEKFIHFPDKGGTINPFNGGAAKSIGSAQKTGCDFNK